MNLKEKNGDEPSVVNAHTENKIMRKRKGA